MCNDYGLYAHLPSDNELARLSALGADFGRVAERNGGRGMTGGRREGATVAPAERVSRAHVERVGGARNELDAHQQPLAADIRR